MNDFITQSDDELVQRSLLGDKDCFRELFQRYGKQVFHYSFALSKNRQEAEDILQEVFLQAFSRLNQYRGPGSFKYWIYAICRNHTVSFLRKKGVSTFSLDSQDLERLQGSFSECRSLSSIHEKESIAHLLESLDPRVREILFLRLVEDLSYREIAGIVGLKEDNLRQVVSRGLAQLRKEQLSDGLQQV